MALIRITNLHHIPAVNDTIAFDTIAVHVSGSITHIYIPARLVVSSYLDTRVFKVTLSTSALLNDHIDKTLSMFGGYIELVAVGDINTIALPVKPTIALVRTGNYYEVYSSLFDTDHTVTGWTLLATTTNEITSSVLEERLAPICVQNPSVYTFELQLDNAYIDTSLGYPNVTEYTLYTYKDKVYLPLVEDDGQLIRMGEISLVDMSILDAERYFLCNTWEEGVVPVSSNGKYITFNHVVIDGIDYVYIYYGSGYSLVTAPLVVDHIAPATYAGSDEAMLSWPSPNDQDVTISGNDIILETQVDVTDDKLTAYYDQELMFHLGSSVYDIDFSPSTLAPLAGSLLAITIYGYNTSTSTNEDYPYKANHPPFISLIIDLASLTFKALEGIGASEVDLTVVNTNTLSSLVNEYCKLRLLPLSTGTLLVFYVAGVEIVRIDSSINFIHLANSRLQWYYRNIETNSSFSLLNITAYGNYRRPTGLGSLCRMLGSLAGPHPCDSTEFLLNKIDYSNILTLNEEPEGLLTNQNTAVSSKDHGDYINAWYLRSTNTTPGEGVVVSDAGISDQTLKSITAYSYSYLELAGASIQAITTIDVHMFIKTTSDISATTPLEVVIRRKPNTIDNVYQVSLSLDGLNGFKAHFKSIPHPLNPGGTALVGDEVISFVTNPITENTLYAIGMQITPTEVTLYVNGVPHTAIPTQLYNICNLLNTTGADYNQLLVKVGSILTGTIDIDGVIVYASTEAWDTDTYTALVNDASLRDPTIDCSVYYATTPAKLYGVSSEPVPQGYGGIIKATSVDTVLVSKDHTTTIYQLEPSYGFGFIDILLTSIDTSSTKVWLTISSISSTNNTTSTLQLDITSQGELYRAIPLKRNEKLSITTSKDSDIAVRIVSLLGK